MTKTVVGLFDTRDAALSAVQSLTDQGIDRSQLSVLASDEMGKGLNNLVDNESTDSAATGAATGAIGGGVLGGAIGLLVGIGALTIPGVGPILAAGPLAAALGLGAAGTTTLVGAGIGAVSGGLLGALVGAGIPEEDASYYAEGIRRGGTLVVAHVDDTLVGQTYSSLRQHGAVDIDERGGEWRKEGWERFDPDGNAWERSSKVGTATGTAAGAATGAAIGSVGGPVGTVIGGVAGAATGAAAGAAGDAVGEDVAEDAGASNPTTPYEREIGRNPVMSSGNDNRPAVASSSVRGGRIYGDGARYDWDETSGSAVIAGTSNTGGVIAPVTAAGYTGDAGDRLYRDAERGDSPTENWKESSKVGTAAGTATGAATGAAIGSVGGPVGTVIGGIAGAATGAVTGAAGDAAGEATEDAYDDDDTRETREATNDVAGRKGQVRPTE